jgi:HAD superfamily hydrolase (TIGR01509 family)
MMSEVGVQCFGKRIEGIVFDIDGTLTDSIEAYYQIFREAAARVGIKVKREDVLEPMATGSLIWDRAIPLDVPERESRIQQCMALMPRIFSDMMQKVELFPGVERILRALSESGVSIGGVTSSWTMALRPIDASGVRHFFKAIVTREDGFRPKPAPDGILECLRRMKVEPDKALAVGDSPLDIRAGKSAGLITVGVLSGIGNRVQLEGEGPAAILNDAVEILSLLGLD